MSTNIVNGMKTLLLHLVVYSFFSMTILFQWFGEWCNLISCLNVTIYIHIPFLTSWCKCNHIILNLACLCSFPLEIGYLFVLIHVMCNTPFISFLVKYWNSRYLLLYPATYSHWIRFSDQKASLLDY